MKRFNALILIRNEFAKYYFASPKAMQLYTSNRISYKAFLRAKSEGQATYLHKLKVNPFNQTKRQSRC